MMTQKYPSFKKRHCPFKISSFNNCDLQNKIKTLREKKTKQKPKQTKTNKQANLFLMDSLK